MTLYYISWQFFDRNDNFRWEKMKAYKGTKKQAPKKNLTEESVLL